MCDAPTRRRTETGVSHPSALEAHPTAPLSTMENSYYTTMANTSNNDTVETVTNEESFWINAKQRLRPADYSDGEAEPLPADECSVIPDASSANRTPRRHRHPLPPPPYCQYDRHNDVSFPRRFLLPIVTAVLVILAAAAAWVRYPSVRYLLRGGVLPRQNVAFIGNSIIYFYDLPRSLEVFSGGRVSQNSVLAGAGSLDNMPTKQNGMWNRWRSDSALLYYTDDDSIDNGSFEDNAVWDFGACSMEMMLFGHDPETAQADYDQWWDDRHTYHIDDDDDGWTASGEGDRDVRLTNPCMQSQAYLNFLASLPASDIRGSVPPKGWHFLVLDDRTAGPRSQANRNIGLADLDETFLPLIQESKVTPILLVTSAYWVHRDQDDDSNENTLENIPYWTVQTYEGYRQYATLLRQALPHNQRPRLVNMGAAFLVVYEENLDLWYNLFWVDYKHQSPHGSFLQTCLLHHAVYGVLPKRSTVIREDMETLWDDTRTLMYPRDATVPFPTLDEAEYLFDVCRRVANGYLPPSFKREMRVHGLSLY